ncbi:MAG: adaptor protein MecA [Eubacteriales bacterium]|nr:adaptor protein MecA [Eubacteriales bacterium]
MEFKKIDDNKFQCLLEKEDLEENHISLDDFFKNNTEKIHGLLEAVMQEAHKNIDVDMDGGVMSLQLAPQPNQSILLTVSSGKDEFGEMLRQAGERAARVMESRGIKPQESNVIKDNKQELAAAPFKDFGKEAAKSAAVWKKESQEACVYRFTSLTDVEDFCIQSPRTWGIQNGLYKDGNTSMYYLVLRKGRCSKQKYDNISMLLREYAQCEDNGSLRALWVEEHCSMIIAANAVNTIKKYCGGSHTC